MDSIDDFVINSENGDVGSIDSGYIMIVLDLGTFETTKTVTSTVLGPTLTVNSTTTLNVPTTIESVVISTVTINVTVDSNGKPVETPIEITTILLPLSFIALYSRIRKR